MDAGGFVNDTDDEVKLDGPGAGQQLKPMDLTQLLQIDLVNKEVFQYLDGSALINLSCVNRPIRLLVLSSDNYKKNVNLRVSLKTMDFLTPTTVAVGPLPEWTDNLTQLTMTFNSELVLVCPEKFSSFTRILPNLSTLVLVNDLQSYTYAATFINKILNLSLNLKSLSIPYDLMLNPITFPDTIGQNLKELKFTTSTYRVKFDKIFETNLNILANTCSNLNSLTCQELVKFQGKYMDLNLYNNDGHYGNIFHGILTIIERNSQGLEKLDFGISTLVVNQSFSSKLAENSFPNLKFLELRAVQSKVDYFMSSHQHNQIDPESSVLDILNNLPHPGELTTLKLTFTTFPIELFDLIPQKFPQLKSLSLKASKYAAGGKKVDEERWNFLQLLTELEELEITRFTIDFSTSNFGRGISENFPDYLQENKLRKLSLKRMNDLSDSSTFFAGIAKMNKLRELTLTGSFIYLDDFLSICENLKDLEKLEISHLYGDIFHHQSPRYNEVIDYREILKDFSSLKYMKELSIEFWTAGDFCNILGSISFPYLKSLTLCDSYLDKDQLESIIGLNGMLKELNIVTLQEGTYESGQEFEIINERNNLKIDFTTKQIETSSSGRGEIREDCDPDSNPLSEQGIDWSDSDSGPEYPNQYFQDSDTDRFDEHEEWLKYIANENG